MGLRLGLFLPLPQEAVAKAEQDHEAAITAAQRHGRNSLSEPAWTYNEAGGSARGQRGPFSLLQLIAMLRGAHYACSRTRV